MINWGAALKLSGLGVAVLLLLASSEEAAPVSKHNVLAN